MAAPGKIIMEVISCTQSEALKLKQEQYAIAMCTLYYVVILAYRHIYCISEMATQMVHNLQLQTTW
jgi:hypothetical protein